MNKIYKTVWSEKKGAFVAVSEIVSSQGKSVSGSEESVIKQPANKLRTLASVLISAGFLFGASNIAIADVTFDNTNNTIEFTGSPGNAKGTIIADDGLTINGDVTFANDITANNIDANDIDANSLTLTNSGAVASGDDKAVTGGTVFTVTDALNGRVTTNEGKITTLNSGLAAAQTSINNLQDGKGGYTGIKYFRVKSTKDDANASGTDSVAIGPLAKATSTNTIALGHASEATGGNAVTFGYKAKASGTDGVAIGSKTQVIGINGIALGNQAEANTLDSISLGLAAGKDSVLTPGGDQKENIAIGANSGQRVKGQTNTALGIDAGQDVTGNQNVAIGPKAGVAVVGDDNISIGHLSNQNLSADSHRSIAIGDGANSATDALAFGTNSQATNHALAFGLNAQATGQGSVALGSGAVAISNSVALGNSSKVYSTDLQSDNVVSVGDSAAAGGITRRIINVADGIEDNDAVTVKQLNAAVTPGVTPADLDAVKAHVLSNINADFDSLQHHYVSITDDNSTPAGNYSNKGATGHYAVAIGPDVEATADNSTAIGSVVSAAGVGSVALGTEVQAKGLNSVTIGQGSESRQESGIAIGTSSKSTHENSIVIGKNAKDNTQGLNGPEAKNSIVIGTEAKSTNIDGMALGREAIARAERGIAQGVGAFAGEKKVQPVDPTKDAIAVGTNAYASADNSIAQGTDARAKGLNSTAIGNQSRAEGASSIAQGDNALATKQDSQAFGTNAQALKVDSQAFGTSAVADGTNSQAFGKGANTVQENSQAFGTAASATGVNSQAFGAGAEASGKNSQAFGTEAFADHANSTAIGNQAKSTHDGSVALGAGSETGEINIGSYFINDASAFSVAGKQGPGTRTVSVGKEGEERQIQHVAPGVVDKDSTDAINGSQLHATNTFANNLGTDTARIFGGDTELNLNGTLKDPNFKFDYDGTNKYQNVQDAMTGLQNLGLNFVGDDGNNVHRKLGQQLEITGGASGNLTDNNIGVTKNDDGLLIQLAENIDLGNAGSVTMGDTVINNDGLTINNGPSITNVGINAGGKVIKNVAPGIDGTDGVNVDQLKNVENIANKGWNYTVNGDAATKTNVAPGGTVNFANTDGNINIDTSADGIDFDLNNQISLGEAGDDGQLIVSDGGTNNTIINPTNITVAGSNPVSIDGNVGDITGLQNTTWDPDVKYEDGRAATEEQLSDVSTHLTDKGLKFVGNDGSEIHKKLGETLGIVGGLDVSEDASSENIRTVQNKDGDLEIELAKDITGLYSIEIGANGNQSITLGGNDDGSLVLNPGGDSAKITNVAPGKLSEDSTDAVNGSQLYATNKKIVNIIGDGAAIDEDGNITMPDFPLYDYKGAPVTSETVYEALGVAQNHYYSVNADPDLGNFNNDGATGKNALAAGVNTLAEGDSSIAIGDGAEALGDKSISIGQGNIVAGSRSTAIGDPNIIIGSDSHAVGNDNYIGIFANNSLAFGNDNLLTSDSTVSVGNNSAIGLSLFSNANNAISVGHDNLIGTGLASTATNAISLGNNNKIATGFLNNGNNAISLGNDNTIRSEDAIALGNNITIGTGLAGSVGIGANSTVAAANPTSSITIGSYTKSFAGDAPQSVVSFGSAGNERQLTNVAAGRINATSTDAINGSQLFAVSDVLGNTVDFIGLEELFDDDGNSIGHGIKFDNGSYTSLNDVLNSLHWNIDVSDGSGPGGSGGTSSGGSGSNPPGDSTEIHHGNTLTLVAGDNIVIEKDPNGGSGDTDITIGLAPDITVDNVVINKDLTVAGKTDLAGGTLVVEDNKITVGPDTFIDMGDNRITNVADGVNRDDAVNKGQLDDTRDALIAKGLNFVGDDGQVVHRDLGQTLSITGGATGPLTSGNIGVVEDGSGGLSVQLAENIDLGSNGSVKMGDTTVNSSGIAIYNSSTGNTVSLSKDGLDNGGNRITNVAPGIAGTDAVNVDQLSAVNNNLQQQIDGNRYDIKRNNNRANAGIAAAMATAGLPQAYLPGKSMVAIAGGVWRGESGVAIGVSTVSENGKWILKGSANTSGRGGAGGTIGAGYQW